ETLKQRLSVYHAETAPLIDYYRSGGKLVSIDGTAEIDAVTAAMEEALDARVDG
ncbi:MAG: adenylate kinase, partial [Pseudomonadota bacterium]